MNGPVHCPICTGADVRRIVSTYETVPGEPAERRTDTYYCGRCDHVWDERPADVPVRGA